MKNLELKNAMNEIKCLMMALKENGEGRGNN